MSREKRKIILYTFTVACFGALLFLPFLAGAGDLEPPSIAVDGSGNPVSTTMTPPSWAKKLPTSERFEMVLDGSAVLDKETGLVWQKRPSLSQTNYSGALYSCLDNVTGGRKGWRLPTIEELQSLVFPGRRNPALPDGYDSYFIGVKFGDQMDLYWASPTGAYYPNGAWVVRFEDGNVEYSNVTSSYWYWCVRGGQGSTPVGEWP